MKSIPKHTFKQRRAAAGRKMLAVGGLGVVLLGLAIQADFGRGSQGAESLAQATPHEKSDRMHTGPMATTRMATTRMNTTPMTTTRMATTRMHTTPMHTTTFPTTRPVPPKIEPMHTTPMTTTPPE